MREAVVVASSRTPLTKAHRGSFNITRPDDLAAHCIGHVLGKVPQLDPKEIDDVILGCGQPHGPQGHNIARVAALRAGLPVTTPGVTVNRFCNSGLQAIVQAAHMILQEGADAAIGGGVESITLVQRDSSPNPWVQEHRPGLYMAMGETAEVVAKRYGVSRDAQDEFALTSQQRTARAQREGFFTGEIAPMRVRRAVLDKTGQPVAEEDHTADRDECNRPGHHTRRTAQAAAGLRCHQRPRERDGRQLLATLRRRVGDAPHVHGARPGARRHAATRLPRLRRRRLRTG